MKLNRLFVPIATSAAVLALVAGGAGVASANGSNTPQCKLHAVVTNDGVNFTATVNNQGPKGCDVPTGDVTLRLHNTATPGQPTLGSPVSVAYPANNTVSASLPASAFGESCNPIHAQADARFGGDGRKESTPIGNLQVWVNNPSPQCKENGTVQVSYTNPTCSGSDYSIIYDGANLAVKTEIDWSIPALDLSSTPGVMLNPGSAVKLSVSHKDLPVLANGKSYTFVITQFDKKSPIATFTVTRPAVCATAKSGTPVLTPATPKKVTHEFAHTA